MEPNYLAVAKKLFIQADELEGAWDFNRSLEEQIRMKMKFAHLALAIAQTEALQNMDRRGVLTVTKGEI